MNSNSIKRLVLAGLIALGILLALPQAADAHPLGNFTVNRYARVEPSAGLVRVTYVLDQAEIPTFQEQKTIDADRDAFAQKRADAIASNLRLNIDGQPIALIRKNYLFTQPTGQGGLPVSRLAIIFEAPITTNSAHNAQFADMNEPDRIGWREIIIKPRGNATVENATAPATDLTNELRRYPANLIQAPLDLRQADFRFTPGTIATSAEQLTSPDQGPTRSDSGFSGLIQRADPGPLAIALLFLLALGFGAVHGVAPGHGKSVMAAYLVGTRGRPIDAVLLGVLVSIMHTGSVLVIGLVLLKVGSETDIAKVYPVLTLLSGLTVVALGVGLLIVRARTLVKARRATAPAHSHDHDHDHQHETQSVDIRVHAHAYVDPAHAPHDTNEHSHDTHTHDTAVHSHGFGSHSHDLPDGVAPLSRRGIALLATSGGLLPSPSAVIVLIGAASTGRLALGLGLIAAFSIGLAAMLTAIGLALVYGRSFLERQESSTASVVLRVLPVLSACALLVGGSVVVAEGLRSL